MKDSEKAGPDYQLDVPGGEEDSAGGLLTTYLSTMETRAPGQAQTFSESFAGC